MVYVRRIIGDVSFVIRNGFRWRDASADYGPHKTIYNRFIRQNRMGVFNKVFAGAPNSRQIFKKGLATIITRIISLRS